MAWNLVLRSSDGRELDVCEIGEVAAPMTLDVLGVDRGLSRRIMAAVQSRVCGLQERELTAAARKHARENPGTEIKDYRARKVQTLFGTVEIKVPRLRTEGKTHDFVSWPKGVRATPELDYVRVKLSAWMSFPKAVLLLKELCPVDGGVAVATAHNRVREFA